MYVGPYGNKVVPKMFEYARDLHGLLYKIAIGRIWLAVYAITVLLNLSKNKNIEKINMEKNKIFMIELGKRTWLS